MKTFILFWNPALSDVKLEDWRKMIDSEVKIADLEDNMDVRRMQELGETDTQRLNKYIKAWNYLNNYKAE